MAESQSLELTPGQMATLQKLLNAGFQFTAIEHVTRHLGVQKGGFIALLDTADGKLKLFGQVGYRIGEGIGMLIERGGAPAFVWKKQEVEATPELFAAYQRVRAELTEMLNTKNEV
ncbi:MAG TPA: hypothetical protein VG028_18720 [Terriglobia bacterium]|nr:hypothetical protein [Terriglobia bacterium]